MSNSYLKTFRNRYRMVIMNDDTFEEVVTFRLSRVSVYMIFSIIFVLLVGLTVALLVLTPLRFYIPGYGKKESKSEIQQLKLKTDSLKNVIEIRQQYMEDLKNVLTGKTPVERDTTTIKVPKPKISKN